MKILAIETSCDDTGISVLDIKKRKNSPEFSVLANIVSSQTALGKKYGGVFPAMAKREHQRNLVPVLIRALKQAKLLKSQTPKPNAQQNSRLKSLNTILERETELQKKLVSFLKKYKKPDIDVIAVTNGPGLEPCLWVGVNFAKAISQFWNIPVVPVNHVESHILVNLLDNKNIKFPAIALIVSGGHTQIILVKKIGQYKILGETRDDAAGECFDKCAKILGLGYPGGPIISKLSDQAEGGLPPIGGSPPSAHLPRPMINSKDYDFSFSGLKTAVLYKVQDFKNSTVDQSTVLPKKYKAQMAAEVQQAIIDVLVKKTIKAGKDYNIKTLMLGGGVSANKELRKQFQNAVTRHCEQQRSNLNLIFPKPELSTDNALMTAITGFYHKKSATSDIAQLSADGNLRIGEKVIK